MTEITKKARVLRNMAYGKFRVVEFEKSKKNLRGAFTKKSRKIVRRLGICRESIDIMRVFYTKRIFKEAHNDSRMDICSAMEKAVIDYSMEI